MSSDIKPWYRQFWPWFLISIPAATVVAAMFTIMLAVTTSDGLVKDDYYKAGLAVNKDLAKIERAEALGLNAQLSYDPMSQRLFVELNNAENASQAQLQLQLTHPTRPNHDQQITLQRDTDKARLYVGKLPTAPMLAYWHINVQPTNSEWIISGRARLPEQTIVTLK